MRGFLTSYESKISSALPKIVLDLASWLEGISQNQPSIDFPSRRMTRSTVVNVADCELFSNAQRVVFETPIFFANFA